MSLRGLQDQVFAPRLTAFPPDLNRKCKITVGTAAPQPRVLDRRQWAPSDLNHQNECQKICPVECLNMPEYIYIYKNIYLTIYKYIILYIQHTLPDRMPEYMPCQEYMPDRMSESMPDIMPGRRRESMPD